MCMINMFRKSKNIVFWGLTDVKCHGTIVFVCEMNLTKKLKLVLRKVMYIQCLSGFKRTVSSVVRRED